ncbi:hypothetical protein GS930_24250 [Rhodococcus hoagii]|nr:hypothetical protein [Prescottella equi]
MVLPAPLPPTHCDACARRQIEVERCGHLVTVGPAATQVPGAHVGRIGRRAAAAGPRLARPVEQLENPGGRDPGTGQSDGGGRKRTGRLESCERNQHENRQRHRSHRARRAPVRPVQRDADEQGAEHARADREGRGGGSERGRFRRPVRGTDRLVVGSLRSSDYVVEASGHAQFGRMVQRGDGSLAEQCRRRGTLGFRETRRARRQPRRQNPGHREATARTSAPAGEISPNRITADKDMTTATAIGTSARMTTSPRRVDVGAGASQQVAAAQPRCCRGVAVGETPVDHGPRRRRATQRGVVRREALEVAEEPRRCPALAPRPPRR